MPSRDSAGYPERAAQTLPDVPQRSPLRWLWPLLPQVLWLRQMPLPRQVLMLLQMPPLKQPPLLPPTSAAASARR